MKNNLGEKLNILRKQNKLTQEQVADELKVTRQTISNWELNQTKPDLDQIKGISKLYKISIDELVDNDIKELITEKISNVEKLTGLVYKILKWLLIFIGIFIIVFILYKIISVSTYAWFIGMNNEYECHLDNKKYHIIIDNEYEEYTVEGKMECCREASVSNIEISPYLSIPELEKQEKTYQAKNILYQYFESKGGSCSQYVTYE